MSVLDARERFRASAISLAMSSQTPSPIVRPRPGHSARVSGKVRDKKPDKILALRPRALARSTFGVRALFGGDVQGAAGG